MTQRIPNMPSTRALRRAIKTPKPKQPQKTTMTLQDLFVLLSFCFLSVMHTHTLLNFFFLNFYPLSLFLSSSFIVLFIPLHTLTHTIQKPQPYMIHEWQWINLNLDLLSRSTRAPLLIHLPLHLLSRSVRISVRDFRHLWRFISRTEWKFSISENVLRRQ
jgi:hypothetical protein